MQRDKAEFDAALKSDQQDLRERQQEHKEEVNKKELELAQKEKMFEQLLVQMHNKERTKWTKPIHKKSLNVVFKQSNF